jgi:antibiotic biosynthesis monooxygenase (ABM) superfamily enzyme
MIARTWRAWASTQNAEAYERFIRDVVFADKLARKPPGLIGMDLLRADNGSEAEFQTILWFTSLAAVEAFAGVDSTRAVVDDEDRRLLSRFDERVRHFDVPVRLAT